MADERTNPFEELTAMQAVAKVLDGLPSETVSRILRWAGDHFLAGSPSPLESAKGNNQPAAGSPYGSPQGSGSRQDVSQFHDAADLIGHVGIDTGPDRALLTAYWVQVVEGNDGFDGFTINSALKNMGYRLSNVTTTLASLMSQKPALVIQVKKSGQSKQARKTYRLTREGINRAERMIRRDDL